MSFGFSNNVVQYFLQQLGCQQLFNLKPRLTKKKVLCKESKKTSLLDIYKEIFGVLDKKEVLNFFKSTF